MFLNSSFKRNPEIVSAGVGCVALFVLMSISALINAFLFPYAINEWLVFFGKEPSVTWWQGVIIGFVPYVSQYAIGIALITWILMLFL